MILTSWKSILNAPFWEEINGEMLQILSRIIG